MKPITYFEQVWSRCELLSGLHLYLDKKSSAILHPDELLRAEWVSRVSALDLFVHELIAQSMVAIFEGRRDATPAYLRFQLSNEIMDRIREAASKAEASSAFDLFVRDQLSRSTFQTPENIADGIKLCSTVELWNEIALRLGATETKKNEFAKDIKRQLSLIVRRRNSIAHEGDLQRTFEREPWPINRTDLEVVASCIEQVVRTIDSIV
jgi:hypothetical protein